ncbi:carboxypeptidase-like regulatory domain-containing protein [Corallococcus sp. M34]|uniref:carboxypeptidase-like regulatory domain-containing protein n=1 Tax=Citreicoccus inhibens TaxID=2849499 RepID=UPI001C24E6DB|nr:carboxypeptidase-like regulatory domain-containing protein [Citreicoccus inhibens]MBU8898479.1 carboxypeptidase-like regulatory domain-containing protein [Citreicoccus inhibens]
MRRWAVAVVVAVVGLVFALGLLVHRAPRATQPHDFAAQSQTSISNTPPRVLAPVGLRANQGTAHIRGIVFDERGPVTGARVLATRAEPGETLSERACEPPPDPERRAEEFYATKPGPCSESSNHELLELVSLREGETLTYADTLSGPGGTFALEGLPDGIFTLWAENARGATVRFGVFTGTEGLELQLGGAGSLTGVVLEEDSFTPIPHARVTAFSARDTRFFDSVTDEEGRLRLGPLPDEVYIRVIITADGWLPARLPLSVLKYPGHAVRLHRPREIHGRVEERGAPVAGAQVHVEISGYGPNSETWNTTSDEQGRFVFESLPPRSYRVTAKHAGLVGFSLGDLEAPQPAEVVLSLVDARFAEGTVRDAAGQPVASASVVLRKQNSGYEQAQHRVAEDGHFRIGPLEPGTYSVWGSAPGYRASQEEELQLTADTKPLEIVLQRSTLIAGRVRDSEKQPVASVTITACPTGPRTLSAMDTLMCNQGDADDDGNFEVTIDKPGEYSVAVQSHEYLSDAVTVRGPAQGVRLDVRRGARLVGEVLDSKNRPMGDVSVSLWENTPSRDPVPGSLQTVTADPQGHFTLQGLHAGRYVVEATQSEGGVERTASQTLELSEDAQAQVTVRFEAGWSLAGIVVDGEGRPIPDARLRATVTQDGLPQWRRGTLPTGYQRVAIPPGVRTGPDGRFVLRQLVANAYDLEVLKDNYICPNPEPCLRVENGQTEARLVMERVAQVRGHVVGPDGAPITRFWVNAEDFENKTGTFSIAIDDTGTVPITITVPKLAPLYRTAEVRRGEDMDLGTLRMEHGRTLSGHVVDAETGQPLAVDLMIAALANNADYPQQHRFHRSAADGTFRLEHLSTSPFSLEISESNQGHLPTQRVITPDVEDLTVRMERGARIEVDVRDAHGRPLPATVEFSGIGQGSRRLRPEDPRVVTGLPAGTYLVRADSESHAHIPSQTVTVPATGKVTVTLIEQENVGGATLKVHVTDRNVGQVLWLPGPLAFPPTEAVLTQAFGMGMRPDTWEPMDIAVFQHLPAGPSTLFFERDWGDSSMYAKEEVDLPAEGTVLREARLKWTEVQNP